MKQYYYGASPTPLLSSKFNSKESPLLTTKKILTAPPITKLEKDK